MENKKWIKQICKNCLKEIGFQPSFSNVKRYVENIGWRLFLYNGHHARGDDLLELLGLSSYAKDKDAFYYHRKNHCFIFLRENLRQDVAFKLFLHELAHILLGHTKEVHHFKEDSFSCEEEADFFVYYFLRQNKVQLFYWKYQNHLVRSALAVICISILVVSLLFYQQNYAFNYYITENGGRYHQIDCQYLQNKENLIQITKIQAEDSGYKPCSICMKKRK